MALLLGISSLSHADISVDKTLESVTLQLKWRHQFQFAGYYAAIEKGYFRDAGLMVHLREATPGMDPAEAVASGQAEYGISTTHIIIDKAAGHEVVAMGAIFQHSPTMVMVRRDSDIASPQNLRGKRLMLTESTDPEVLSMLRNEGIGPGQVTLLPHSWNIDDLIQGRTDAMTVYSTNEPYLMQQRGVPYTLINPLNYGIDYYGDCLFTSRKEAAEHPQRVAAFLEASQRGWVYAMSHREEIADLIIARYNPGKTRPQLLFEAAEMEKLILPDLVEIGHMNPWRWRRIADQYAAMGLLPAGYPIEGFLFSPPQPWPHRYWRVLVYGTAGAIAAGALAVLALAIFNRRLRRAVQRQTATLQESERRLRSAAEEAQLANAAKDRFLASLSHELRTPLTPVLAALTSAENAPDLGQDMQMMRRCVEMEARLIDDLLDVTRITQRRLVLDLRPLDAHELLQRALDLAQQEAYLKQQQIRVEMGAASHRIRGDASRLQQAFWHVMKNAVQYTPEGGTIVVKTHNSEAPDAKRRLVVSVRDNGVGIAVEMLPAVFDAFERRGSVPSGRGGGLGMGLLIARAVIELHGGCISASSEGPGKGSTFTITLPTLEAAIDRLAAGQATDASSRRLRILLVEDHQSTLGVMTRLLRRMGHEVATASSVAEGLQKGNAEEFDLLLSDIGLPDGTGHQIIEALRGQGRILRAIAFSGYGMDSDIQSSREAGFTAHLVKPVDVATLRAAIETACSEAATQSAH